MKNTMHLGTWINRALALSLCFLLSPLPAFCQAGGAANQAGLVSALDPSATRNGAPTKVREDVFWNDQLQTNAAGRMRVNLRDGSILSLGSNSQMHVVQHDAAAQQTTLEMLFGRLRSQVVKLTQPNSKFEVHTPTAVAGVIGTDFVLVVTPDKTTVIVYSGIVSVTPLASAALGNASQTVRVNPGQQVEVTTAGVGPVTTVATAVLQSLLQETAVSHAGLGAAAGTVAVGSTHVLRTVLIALGVVAGGTAAGVAVANSHSNGTSQTPTQSGPSIPPR
jgi:hypothetical protein